MAQYKTVAGPIGLAIKHDQDYGAAVKQYAALIDKEAVGGWKLHCIEEISVTKQPPATGCLDGILIHFNLKQRPMSTEATFNMLVFVKEE